MATSTAVDTLSSDREKDQMRLRKYLSLGVIACSAILGSKPHYAQSTIPMKPELTDMQRRLMEIATQATTYEERRRAIELLPADDVILAVTDGLEHGVFRDEKLRGFSYRTLSDLGAVKTDAGFRWLLTCLDDSRDFLALCVGALTRAPTEKIPDVVVHLAAILGAEETTDREKLLLVKAMGDIGKPASAHLKSIERIFKERTADERLRGSAAFAMLKIGGLEYAVERFASADPTGQRALLPYLARYIGETEQTLGSKVDPGFTQHRREARKLVLPAMRSEDVSVRKAALEALPMIYGEEALIIRSRDDYEMDAEYRKAVQEMAMQDSDADLRERAAKMIDPGFVELKVEAIFRRKARRESGSQP
jgi:hypothetical protein